ncbi:hypothetical protein F0342_10850 [Bacillus sp. CH30_1T]|uniref:hypothetical protein n=1 Tax=Bacillus sp. CH30_1T TaxID=2604836 RepID=UPI0011EDF24B|nr:hypothetical protein [Bacillus sp. CH30_1T]KAA0564638.1 hypothetical protein F0342_10850 [Bacillus sp. CH30_1T]
MRKLNKFFYDFLGMENKDLDGLTLHNIEEKMKDEKFPERLIQQILMEFNKMIREKGEKNSKSVLLIYIFRYQNHSEMN